MGVTRAGYEGLSLAYYYYATHVLSSMHTKCRAVENIHEYSLIMLLEQGLKHAQLHATIGFSYLAWIDPCDKPVLAMMKGCYCVFYM